MPLPRTVYGPSIISDVMRESTARTSTVPFASSDVLTPCSSKPKRIAISKTPTRASLAAHLAQEHASLGMLQLRRRARNGHGNRPRPSLDHAQRPHAAGAQRGGDNDRTLGPLF